MPARTLSDNNKTMGLKGRHMDKLRITYKAKRDGFQCKTIYNDGYTLTFSFCNQPAPKKYLDSGFSPLHAHCMSLFG